MAASVPASRRSSESPGVHPTEEHAG